MCHTKKKNNKAIEFCGRFLRSDTERRYIFGTNEYAISISKQVHINAFIDDFKVGEKFEGRPIIGTGDIPDDALVVSSVVSSFPLTVKEMLSSAGVDHIDYFSFYRNSGLNLKPVTFFDGFEEDYSNNFKKYENIKSRLSDDLSINTFDKIVNFRLSGDLAYMEGFKIRPEEQYFENFLPLKKSGEVFVDVGGFDGETARIFSQKYPDYQAIYIFEPEQKNFENIRGLFDGYNNIHLINVGLSNQKQVLKFNASGSSSSISANGGTEIMVDTLDNCVSQKVTFIKMDIEGAEISALEGAKKTILKNHPTIAVCVYHKFNDFWKIPEIILSVRDDYNIYLRHYTEGVTETVMFFVPLTKKQYNDN